MKAALRSECRPLGTDHAQMRFVIGSVTRPRACHGALCSPSGSLVRHHCRIFARLAKTRSAVDKSTLNFIKGPAVALYDTFLRAGWTTRAASPVLTLLERVLFQMLTPPRGRRPTSERVTLA